MLLRRITDFILQNRVQAMAAAFLFAFLPYVGSIGILIAAFVTLRKSVIDGALVALAATVPYLISYGVSASSADQTPMAMVLLGIILLGNFLTWIFAVVLRQFNNWNFTLELAALIGVLTIGLAHLVNPNIQDWWAGELASYFAKTTEAVSKLNVEAASQSIAKEAQLQAVNVVKQFATGFLVVSILFNALLQVVIARWWQAVMFNPGGLRLELYHIRLSQIAAGVYLVFLALAYLGVDVALDVLPVLCMIFFLAGLSLIHERVNLTKLSWLWLLIIYFGIVRLFPLSVILVSVIALFDTGIDFRKRFKILKR